MRTWNLHHTYVVGLNKGSTHLFSRQSKKAFIYNKILIEIHSNRKVWTLDFSSKSQSFTQSMERNQVMLSITPDNVWWMWVALQREKHRERGTHYHCVIKHHRSIGGVKVWWWVRWERDGDVGRHSYTEWFQQ